MKGGTSITLAPGLRIVGHGRRMIIEDVDRERLAAALAQTQGALAKAEAELTDLRRLRALVMRLPAADAFGPEAALGALLNRLEAEKTT